MDKKMSLEEFTNKMNEFGDFYDDMREEIEEVGGLNLWDSGDMNLYYEVYLNL